MGIVAYKMAEGSEGSTDTEEWNLGAQVVGWTSAALYLGSRVPQIALNMKTRCVGLSLLMFAYVSVSCYIEGLLLTFSDA